MHTCNFDAVIDRKRTNSVKWDFCTCCDGADQMLPMWVADYEMDFDALEEQIDDRTRMLLLCSPHNPVGRVWTRAELERLADIVLRHDLLVFADEIHGDLVFPGIRHTPFASLSPEIAARTITGVAPSKTFNIAGLDQALSYLAANVEYLQQRLKNDLPRVSAVQPEGTFVMWLDFSRLGLTQTALRETIFCGAQVGLNDGTSFGAGGEGHMRINIGCPPSMVEEGVARISAVL